MIPDIQNVADEFPALAVPSTINQQRSIQSQKITKSRIGSRNSSPPIIMDMGSINVHKLSQILVSTVGNAFSISVKTDRVVIHTSDVKVIEAIINNIKDYDFDAYSTSDSKPHNLLIKGLLSWRSSTKLHCWKTTRKQNYQPKEFWSSEAIHQK